jgi:hypothetical protein
VYHAADIKEFQGIAIDFIDNLTRTPVEQYRTNGNARPLAYIETCAAMM